MHPILRTNTYHSQSIKEPIASASAIRSHIKTHDISHTTPMDLNGLSLHHLNDYEALIKYRLTLGPAYLKTLLMVDEGIENLLYKHRHLPLVDMIAACTNQKYSTTRIQRTLMAILLNIEKTDVTPITAVRVLGMSAKGQAYLKELRDLEISPVVGFKHYPFKDIELKATEIYASVKDDATLKKAIADELQTIIGIHES